jgi:hypothetical protein
MTAVCEVDVEWRELQCRRSSTLRLQSGGSTCKPDSPSWQTAYDGPISVAQASPPA